MQSMQRTLYILWKTKRGPTHLMGSVSGETGPNLGQGNQLSLGPC